MMRSGKVKEEQFTLEEQVFPFEKEETSWRLDASVQKWIARIYAIYSFGSPSSLVLEQSMTADQTRFI